MIKKALMTSSYGVRPDDVKPDDVKVEDLYEEAARFALDYQKLKLKGD